jgi:hypothetical protein
MLMSVFCLLGVRWETKEIELNRVKSNEIESDFLRYGTSKSSGSIYSASRTSVAKVLIDSVDNMCFSVVS